jgi:sialidase-1
MRPYLNWASIMLSLNLLFRALSRAIVAIAALSFGVQSARAAAVEAPVETDVFVSGTNGYHTFRIPSLIVAKDGTLLAFAEGRKQGRSDTGDIDLVLRSSKDNGRSWSKLDVIVDDDGNTVGNPCPVVDRSTGVIWLLLTRNLGADHQKQIMAGRSTGSRTVLVTSSSDNGVTWNKPVDITPTVKEPGWGWYATGPGVGIQLVSGRLLIPCDHSIIPSAKLYSHVIYSDDHGRSWRLGGVLPENTDECQVVELADETLLLNMRSFHGNNRRAIARSKDEGITWGEISFDERLIEPVCQASILRLSLADQETAGSRNRILFANPADKKRQNLTIRVSEDEGATWPIARQLCAGSSAYCCLAVLPEEHIGCLYERDDYKKITLARLSLTWLLAGQAKSDETPK